MVVVELSQGPDTEVCQEKHFLCLLCLQIILLTRNQIILYDNLHRSRYFLVLNLCTLCFVPRANTKVQESPVCVYSRKCVLKSVVFQK